MVNQVFGWLDLVWRLRSKMSKKDFYKEGFCCLEPYNLEETMRVKEGRGVFVWLKCKVCDQLVLSNPKKKSVYVPETAKEAKRKVVQ